MKNIVEWVDITHDIANDLENRSSARLSKELAEANARHNGYVQACEDFAKIMREKFREEQG